MDSQNKVEGLKEADNIKDLKEELVTWEMINSKDADAESNIGAGIMYMFFKIKKGIKNLIFRPKSK